MITLGDIKRLELPDDTPIIVETCHGPYDFMTANVLNVAEQEDTGEGYWLLWGNEQGTRRLAIRVAYDSGWISSKGTQ